MEVRCLPDGTVRAIYDETIDLQRLGAITIARASFVEPVADGTWQVDLSPVGGPRLSGFSCRSQALAREAAWLTRHWL